MQAPGWLYYKIYVGNIAGGLDHLITGTLPKLCCRGDIERWFFIRYLDEGGLHLRLRLKPCDGAGDLRPMLHPILEEALRALPRVPPPFYRPVISRPVAGALRRGGLIRTVESEYEPEVGNFGEQGISVAEALFQLSSEVAMAVLIGERADLCSRKTLAPILMKAVFDAFLPHADLSFWRRYSRYWLQITGESAQEWEPRFQGKARDLRTRGVPVLMPDAALTVQARDAVHAWCTGLSRGASDFETLQEPMRMEWPALASTFIHLMNSRLGIVPIEEAYLSALLNRNR